MSDKVNDDNKETLKDLITEDEIRQIKENPAHISLETVAASKELPHIAPFHLKSGYIIGYSIDELCKDLKFEHISVGRREEILSDIPDKEKIAEAILGKGYEAMGTFFVSEVSHYMKLVK